MEKKSFNYLIKNIPIPNGQNYKLQLLEKMELYIKRMGQKAITHNTGCKQNRNVDTKNF